MKSLRSLISIACLFAAQVSYGAEAHGVSAAESGSEAPDKVFERALWEAGGIQQLDGLPDLETKVREALKDEKLKRLIEIAPRSAQAGLEKPVDARELSAIIATWWNGNFEKVVNADAIHLPKLVRELMVDRLLMACIPKETESRVFWSVRCEHRDLYEKLFHEDPRWIVEYVATMGSRHDRLAWLEKNLKEPPLPPPDYLRPELYLTTLHEWIVIALYNGGGGTDWSTPEGFKLLGVVLEKDNHMGLRALLVPDHDEKLPAWLAAGIRKKIIESRLDPQALEAVIPFVRHQPYAEASGLLKAVVRGHPQPSVKAKALDLALQMAAEKGVDWINEVLPAGAIADFTKLSNAAALPKKDLLQSVRNLLALENSFVNELMVRMSIRAKWFDNQVAEILVLSRNRNEYNTDFTLDVTWLIASGVSWKQAAGAEVLRASLENVNYKRELRQALLDLLEKSGEEGYASVVLPALSPERAGKYNMYEIISMINIATNDRPKSAEVGKVVESFLDKDSPAYGNHPADIREIIFRKALFACGAIPGSAPRIKGVILEGLRNDKDPYYKVAAARAVKSWPADQPLDDEIVQAMSRVLSSPGDAVANVHRLDTHYYVDKPEENTSAKLELLDFLQQRKQDVPKFKKELEEIASVVAEKPGRASHTLRMPSDVAKELLK